VLTDPRLREIAGLLVAVRGVEGVMLGGSRARGVAEPDSDVDLGLYYRPPLDVAGLRALAAALARSRGGADEPTVTRVGAWGPWVDGGGWLTIDDVAVDWLYRDLDRVQRSWRTAQDGRFDVHFQVGHPLGVPDFAYAGEVALGVVLADPSGELTNLQEQATTYPPRLAAAVVDRLGEADFLLGGLKKSAGRGDVAVVAGTLFRVVGLCAHALHARSGCWVINEKGLIGATGRLAATPPGFVARVHMILGSPGTDAATLLRTVAAARALLDEVAAACADA
jgi:hypothetical protein